MVRTTTVERRRHPRGDGGVNGPREVLAGGAPPPRQPRRSEAQRDAEVTEGGPPRRPAPARVRARVLSGARKMAGELAEAFAWARLLG